MLFKKKCAIVAMENNIICLQQQEAPFVGEVPNNLTVGSVIFIKGFVLPTCNRFAVDLKCGKEPNLEDIALHLNPRLDRNYVVRNTRLRGYWGEEETANAGKCDIQRNNNLEIAIFIADGEFLISLNGKHFCSYKFRVPLNLITKIEILGDVEISDVSYKTWETYEERKSENIPMKTDTVEEVSSSKISDSVSAAKNVYTIPYTGHLPNGFQEGWQMEICGRVKLLPHSFYINLQDGAQLWPHPIIPLHLNPRFRGDYLFVRNAWLDGRWGQEERTPGFPFSPGSPFNLTIQRNCDNFAVWIDEKLIGEFKHRKPIENIDTVFIQGDVVIKNIIMHCLSTNFLQRK